MDEISTTISPYPVQSRVGAVSAVADDRKRADTDRQTVDLTEAAAEPNDGDPIAKAESVINQLVELVDHPNSRLQIELHEKTGQFVYKAVNTESGEVLKQYPAEQVLRQIEFFREIQGLAVNRTA